MVPLSGWNDCQQSISQALASVRPNFIGRVGGSDTDALAAMIEGGASKEASNAAALSHLPIVKRYNGYYDHSGNDQNYFQYLELLRQCYLASSYMALVDSKLLSMFFPQNLNPIHRLTEIPLKKGLGELISQVDAVNVEWVAYPYTFFQTLMGQLNLFRVFEQVLMGRKVLVASPFSESFRQNWSNRESFFKDFKYPDFELKLLNTPITYDGLPREMYPHNNWFETLDSLKTQLSKIEYDILLLSCGSYAMPLGLHSCNKLGRSAIYVGGILQLFFGVMGRRYENPFFLDFINSEKFIFPVERDKFMAHVTITSDTAKEAFGAYF